jgi:acetolactate synthase-1/2/3 large subunit
MNQTGADLIVDCLESLHVEYVFGIPGAKVDRIFDALRVSKKIKLIVCRHEQNAAFMAAAYGRLSGKPGVVLVTSGPGVTNLTTGLLTATTEGAPIVAIGANVSQDMLPRQTHQALDNARLMQVVSKFSIEVQSVSLIPETIMNAFRIAMTPTKGACFISVPQNVLLAPAQCQPLAYVERNEYGLGDFNTIKHAARLIERAKQPILLLGMNAGEPKYYQIINDFITRFQMPVIATFQATGMVSKKNKHQFISQVGLFRNEPGDLLIEFSDLVIAVGFDPVEYDPEIWNAKQNKKIIHIGYHPSKVRWCYLPALEVLGDIIANFRALSEHLPQLSFKITNPEIIKPQQDLFDALHHADKLNGSRIHPLSFLHELQKVIDEQWTLCCDVGTVYMWVARYFLTYRPQQLLFSNGQQTLGVALPWAMGCHYANPNSRCISISGDGGFLFSAMELETAVREHIPLIHFIWQDGSYDMVKQQQLLKYGHSHGVEFGAIDVVHFAQAFGALGFDLKSIDEFESVFNQALAAKQPVLINVPIDYQDNAPLFKIADNLS